MKCEICHQSDAETVLRRGDDVDAEELYVCKACAEKERRNRQKKSQRTRKVSGLPPGVSMSVTQIGGGDEQEIPEMIGNFISGLHDVLNELKNVERKAGEPPTEKSEPMHAFDLSRIDSDFRVCGMLHLEGLSLIGEIDAVKRAVRALKAELKGLNVDGVCDCGHVYEFKYSCSLARAKRIVGDLMREERNARVRLRDESPRIFGDAICRSLAILKNCRLLSNGEYFDLLSPLALAARERLLDGADLAMIEREQKVIRLSGLEERLSQEDRDKIDALRADGINKKFEDVVLNERGEEILG